MFDHEDPEEFKKRYELALDRRKVCLLQKDLKCSFSLSLKNNLIIFQKLKLC